MSGSISFLISLLLIFPLSVFSKDNGVMTPIVYQIQTVTPSVAVTSDEFGSSVAIDGDTAIIGSVDANNDNGIDAGAAYIYVRSGATWSLQQTLLSDVATAEERYGSSVAVKGDIAVVGSSPKGFFNDNSGTVYIYTRTGTTWTLAQKLTTTDTNDDFGDNVAFSGTTIVVGAVGENDNGPLSGAVYVFTESGGVWSEQAKLLASDGESFERFGIAVAIDGDTIIAGAEEGDGAVNGSGAAYIFTRTGSVWSEQAKLTASDGVLLDRFGTAVAVEGDTAVVGAFDDDDAGGSSGSAYVFTRTGITWSQQAKLTASDAQSADKFGISVGVEGDFAVIASENGDGAQGSSGLAYLFQRTGTVWTEYRRLIVSDGLAGESRDMRIAIDATTVVMGNIDGNSASPFRETTKSNFERLGTVLTGEANFFNLLAPTSASARLSGRVLLKNGRGISNAILYLIDQNGSVKTVRTNNFGYFTFEDVEVGQTFALNTFHKEYQFDSQIINFDESISSIEIIAR